MPIEDTFDGNEWNDGSFPEEPVAVLGDDFDESDMQDVPDAPEETDAERNNRLLHQQLVAAAMFNMSQLPRGRVQARYTKKRAKKLSGKERRKRQKQSRASKK